MCSIPTYLRGYEAQYEEDPRAAATEWFSDAKFGLFLHYGLYSILGEHEWVQQRKEIPVGEYAQLQSYFTADGFDAEAIVDLALDCEMAYVTLTTRHHDSFCLFDTDQSTFNSVEAPANRDLVGELATACRDAGLGLFLYYSHGRDWHHPHAPNNDEWGGSARPEYESTTPYADEGHDLQQYLDFMSAQIDELLSNYGPIAGIWLDGYDVPAGNPDPFDLPGLYQQIHDAQPQTLVSYKQGLTGTEDFVAPEHDALDADLEKPGEICTTMIPGASYEDEETVSWGYRKAAAGKHKTVEDVWKVLQTAREHEHNLLLNTGPLPDGSIDPEDEAVLRAVGERIRTEGFPGRRSPAVE